MLQCVTYSDEGKCCSVLQCVAVCCSVLQCVAVCCSVLHCAAVCCSVLQCIAICGALLWMSVLQSVVLCCCVIQHEAALAPSSPQARTARDLYIIALQCVAVCGDVTVYKTLHRTNVLQCVPEYGNVLQCVAVLPRAHSTGDRAREPTATRQFHLKCPSEDGHELGMDALHAYPVAVCCRVCCKVRCNVHNSFKYVTRLIYPC